VNEHHRIYHLTASKRFRRGHRTLGHRSVGP
jgi:hypothetical protein